MPNHVQNVDRFLVAREGGLAVPEDVLTWLENGLRTFKKYPAINLTQELGLGNGDARFRVLERQKLFQWHYIEYEKGKTKNRASEDISNGLEAVSRSPDDLRIEVQYKLLFKKISRLGLKLPSQETVYADLRNEIADFVPNGFP